MIEVSYLIMKTNKQTTVIIICPPFYFSFIQHGKNLTVQQSARISEQTVMRCILLSKGPITTQNTLRNNFTKLRHITKEEFLEAGKKLEGFSLGSFVKIMMPKSKRFSLVFIKNSPQQVEGTIGMMPGLCTLQEYSERFAMRIPPVISLRMRAELVNLGYVTEKQLK